MPGNKRLDGPRHAIYIAGLAAILALAALLAAASLHITHWPSLQVSPLYHQGPHPSIRIINNSSDQLDKLLALMNDVKQRVVQLEQQAAAGVKQAQLLEQVSAAVKSTQEAVSSAVQQATKAGEQLDKLAAAARTEPIPAAAAAAAPKPPRVKRLVVSMSSFPGRAEFAIPTVYSIMYGKRVPDALYFWVAVNVSRLATGAQPEIPGPAKSVGDQFRDVLKVRIAPKDYGPATKLLPTLEAEQDPDTVIVTVDDDTYYHPDTVFDLEQGIIKRPGHAIVRSCEETFKNPQHDPPTWRQWKLTEGLCAGFMTAYASAAYRRSFFDSAVFKQETGPSGCLHHDDVWFAGNLWVRHVPIWVLAPHVHAWPPMYHRPTNHMSISAHPDAEKKALECLDYFGWMNDTDVRTQLLGDREPYRTS